MLVTTVSSLPTHCKKTMTVMEPGHCVMLMMITEPLVGYIYLYAINCCPINVFKFTILVIILYSYWCRFHNFCMEQLLFWHWKLYLRESWRI